MTVVFPKAQRAPVLLAPPAPAFCTLLRHMRFRIPPFPRRIHGCDDNPTIIHREKRNTGPTPQDLDRSPLNLRKRMNGANQKVQLQKVEQTQSGTNKLSDKVVHQLIVSVVNRMHESIPKMQSTLCSSQMKTHMGCSEQVTTNSEQ